MKLFPWLCVLLSISLPEIGRSEDALRFTAEPMVAQSGFDGETCWVHARAGIVPPGQPGNESDNSLVVMTMQALLLSGSDTFYELNSLHSQDLGESWSEPIPQAAFQRQVMSGRGTDSLPTGAPADAHLLQAGDETTVCDFVPMWHAASQRLLGIGQTVWYRNNHVLSNRPRGIAYSVYDAARQRWAEWQTVALPQEEKFVNAGAGSGQRVDLPGGDILLPISFKRPEDRQYSVTVCRMRFDGHRLHYLTHGDELTVPIARGLYEPSLTTFQGRYFLTLRNDEQGYVAVSADGLHFDAPRTWKFDDGSELGNYNTQQHWVTHSDGLFLVYTRRGVKNDHVFRHRAPLFMAAVDPDSLQVIRRTEQIVVPEHGARLGNFGVVDVSPNETWVTAAEWMQPQGVEQYGSDNRIFVSKVKWSRPNTLVTTHGERNVGERSGQAKEMLEAYFNPPPDLKNDFGDFKSPLQFTDGSRVENTAQWTLRRSQLVQEWESLLGKWPDLITKPDVEILATERREDFTQYQIRFAWMPGEKTTGYLLIPDGTEPRPAVVCVFYEPETAIGKGSAEHRDFALQLTRRGFVTLSIGTTDASEARTYALYYPSLDDAKVAPLSMLGYAAANAWHVLASRPEVDSQRIGIVGHSFGGKWAMFAACLFDKFACGAWSDPGIVFDESRPSVNYWEPWYLGYHPPPWRTRGLITPDNPARGLYPKLRADGHDLHELHSLMAPRPFLVSGGAEDPITRWQALNHTVALNRMLGYTDRVAMTNRPDHSPNADSNEILCAFFEAFLKLTDER